MKQDKYIIVVDDFDHNLLINGINRFRNDLLEEEKPTEDVDRLLMRIIEAPLHKEFPSYGLRYLSNPLL